MSWLWFFYRVCVCKIMELDMELDPSPCLEHAKHRVCKQVYQEAAVPIQGAGNSYMGCGASCFVVMQSKYSP